MVLAYSSISHMGIVLIGLGVLNEAGLQGAIFQVISHGLIAALLFFVVGAMYERTSTTELSDLGGISKTMPYLAGFMLAGGMASLGLPGMSGFVSEFMTFLGLFQEYPILGAIGAVGIILTAVYILRAVLSITFGKVKLNEATTDIRGIEWIPLIMLTGLIIFIGVYPTILTEPLNETLKLILTGIGG